MKMPALILPLLLTACVTDPYGDDPYRDPYGGREPVPYPAPYPDEYGTPQPGMNEPYRAIGTEPFWSLNIDRREMRFETADGLSHSEPTPPVRPGRTGDIFEGRRLVVIIDQRRCSDGMSDRIYPDSVRLFFDGREWRGCGAPESLFRQDWEGSYPPGSDYPPPPPSVMLDRTNWTIMSINGQSVPKNGYFINFLPGELNARFGCNRISASTSQSGNMLTAGPLQSTRMACPDMTHETAASNILGAAAQVGLDRDRLVIRNSRGNIVARRAD
jgi:heat shock protein HslJ